MKILGQNCDYADFWKVTTENCEQITSSIYDNNLVVLGTKWQ